MSAISAITPAKIVAMVMRYVSRFLTCEISWPSTASSSRFGIVAQEAGRDSDVARLRAEPGGERVRRRVVDDPDLGRHRQPRGDRDVLDEAPQRPQLVRADLLRVGHSRRPCFASEMIAKIAYRPGNHERDHAEPEVEHEPDEPGEDAAAAATKPTTTMPLRRRFRRICCWSVTSRA